eukprot:14163128-Alexandrium_andersonii.AAC.1
MTNLLYLLGLRAGRSPATRRPGRHLSEPAGRGRRSARRSPVLDLDSKAAGATPGEARRLGAPRRGSVRSVRSPSRSVPSIDS